MDGDRLRQILVEHAPEAVIDIVALTRPNTEPVLAACENTTAKRPRFFGPEFPRRLASFTLQ